MPRRAAKTPSDTSTTTATSRARVIDAKAPEPRIPEPRIPEPRLAARAPGNKTSDSSASNARLSDARLSDARLSDARLSNSSQIPVSRALVAPQRVTRKQAALVTQQSRKLPGMTETRTTKAVTVYSGEGNATTVLPAARHPHAHAGLPAFAPARKGRRLGVPAGVLVAVAFLAVLAGALYTISPLSPIRNHSSDFAPQAALMALNSNDTQSGGPWDTAAGAAQALGIGGGAGPGVDAPGSAGLPVGNGGDGGNFTASPGAVFISAAPVSPWPPSDPFMAVPNHPAYRVNTSGGFYAGAFGQCTWWAAYSRRDENLTYLGNARYWAVDAQARGLRVGRQAAPNATVVFYPGAEGAGGAGHVAHVEAVYPNGWFLVSEMNFYWNGGGWGRIDYRFAHEGPGVAFIY